MSVDPTLRGLALSMRLTDREIGALLASIAKETAALIKSLTTRGQTVRAAQLTMALAEMRRLQEQLWNGVDASIRRGIERSRREALASATYLDSVVLRRLGSADAAALRSAWVAQAARGIQVMVLREQQGVTRRLSERVYKNRALSQGWVEKRIRVGLAQGLSNKEFSDSVRGLISPNVKGGVSYAALRLSRTEISNAHHAAQIAAQTEAPWVEGFRWKLSGSHPEKDICDTFAAHEEGLGPGVFSKLNVPPAKAHPRCLCYLLPSLGDDEKFIRDIRSGVYDHYMTAPTAA